MFKIQNSPKLSSSWQSSFRLEHWDFGHWKFVSDFDLPATWLVVSCRITGSDSPVRCCFAINGQFRQGRRVFEFRIFLLTSCLVGLRQSFPRFRVRLCPPVDQFYALPGQGFGEK
jgi:hypothetical protein